MKKTAWLAGPYLVWMAFFIIIPLVMILVYAVMAEGGALSLAAFEKFFQPVYLRVLARSVWLALLSTVICLLIGYPAAMFIAGREKRIRNILLLLFLVPMWMNFLLRTYAWMTLLGHNGLINRFLSFLGLPILDLMYNDGAVVLGMVYNFLPFMVLPIYTVLHRMDRSLIEAARDLGAGSAAVFRKVTLPLSMPGIASGITMVFMPAVSTFVISRLLGGGQYMLIGNLVEQQFLVQGDWHFGSAISLILIVVILLSMAVMARFEKGQEGGTTPW